MAAIALAVLLVLSAVSITTGVVLSAGVPVGLICAGVLLATLSVLFLADWGGERS